MSQRYDYFNTSENAVYDLWGVNWVGQTFIASSDFTITSVKVKGYRVSTPGIGTFSIRLTDAIHKPTGGDLVSGTYDLNSLTTTYPGVWFEIPFSAGYALSIGTEYSIIMRAPSGNVSKRLQLWYHVGAPSYTNGYFSTSSNSGSSWTVGAASDVLFEAWGNPPVTSKLYIGGLPAAKRMRVLQGW